MIWIDVYQQNLTNENIKKWLDRKMGQTLRMARTYRIVHPEKVCG